MANGPMNTREQTEYLRKLASYYNEKGETALTEDIIKSVREEKAAGRLNNDMIRNMANLISRFVSVEQAARLNALVAEITSE